MSTHNGVPICPHGIHPAYCRLCFGPPLSPADQVKVQAWDVSSTLRREHSDARARVAELERDLAEARAERDALREALENLLARVSDALAALEGKT